MKRRDFLGRSGLFLAAWGISEAGLALLTQRYGRALAEPTNRKLALLIGINQYKETPLRGCLTDVELQRELLIHRFGFQPSDIVTLTDQKATRETIQTAFQEHLAQQAKPDDTVVFHFSGYGGFVADGSTSLQPSVIPVDEPIATDAGLVVEDLPLQALGLLARSLATDKFTAILDIGHAYPGKPLLGNLRVRSRAPLPAQLSEAALALQKELVNRINSASRRSLERPGTWLTAANPNQPATEAQWNGFSAGVFTLALTQALWQATSPATLPFLVGQVRQQVSYFTRATQQPQLRTNQTDKLSLHPYYLSVSRSQADAVVTSIDADSKTLSLWLGGLPTAVLAQYGADSLLTVATAPTPTLLQLLSREGLTAVAKVIDQADMTGLQPGLLVKEKVRLIPRGLNLAVGLDDTLERHERVDAISALSGIARVSIATAGEETTDYLFRKITQPTQVAATNLAIVAASAPQNSFGLFSPAQNAIPSTVGESGEAVKVAVRRLVPKFQSLLAAKLLSLTENQNATKLAVRASLEVIDSKPKTVQQRVSGLAAIASLAEEALPTLPVSSRIQYRIENRGPEPLYYLLLRIDSGGNLLTWYQSIEATEATVDQEVGTLPPIAPGEMLVLPQADAGILWAVRKPAGFAEAYLLCSQTPFTESCLVLKAALKASVSSPAVSPLPNPLELAQAILQDLHQASSPDLPAIASNNSYALDVTAWSGLHFIYQVV